MSPAVFARRYPDWLASGELQLLERSRFQHRLTTGGRPVHYELLVATKDASPPRDG